MDFNILQVIWRKETFNAIDTRSKDQKKADAIGAGVEGNLKGQARLDQRTRRSLSRMDLQTRFERSELNLLESGEEAEGRGWPVLAANKLNALV